jgi:hypothetical protein
MTCHCCCFVCACVTYDVFGVGDCVIGHIGAYIGNRPVKLRKSEWNERDLYTQRAQNKEDKKKAKRAKKLIEDAGTLSSSYIH